MKALLLSVFFGAITASQAFASTDREVGLAVGIAAGVKCSVEKEYISEAEEIPLLEYYLEQNNVTHLNEYLNSDKGQTITRILVSGYMTDNCELNAPDRKTLAKLNKLILFYAPK